MKSSKSSNVATSSKSDVLDLDLDDSSKSSDIATSSKIVNHHEIEIKEGDSLNTFFGRDDLSESPSHHRHKSKMKR